MKLFILRGSLGHPLAKGPPEIRFLVGRRYQIEKIVHHHAGSKLLKAYANFVAKYVAHMTITHNWREHLDEIGQWLDKCNPRFAVGPQPRFSFEVALSWLRL